jgi:hypothetical protein
MHQDQVCRRKSRGRGPETCVVGEADKSSAVVNEAGHATTASNSLMTQRKTFGSLRQAAIYTASSGVANDMCVLIYRCIPDLQTQSATNTKMLGDCAQK